MAKGNQKYERQATEREQARSQGEYDSFLNQFLGRQQTPQSIATGASIGKGSKTGLAGMIGNRAGTGGNQNFGQYGRQDLVESSRYKDLIGAGDEERGYLKGGFKNFAETGGVDPADFERLRSYGDIGPAAQANLSDFGEERGYYRDFANTGGYTDKDIARVRAQSAQSAPKLYEALKGQQALSASRMGANAGSTGAFDLKNARAAAQQSAQDKLAANIGLAESQRAGKQFGITGLESTQTTMDRGKLENAGMLNQHSIAQAGIRGDIESRIADMTQRGKQYGLSSLQDLYGQDYAPGRNFEQTWLNAIGASREGAGANRGLQLQNDEINRSRLMENIMSGVGAAAGGITGVGSIGKALGGLRKPKIPAYGF
jgi:hypothetical protein